MATRRIVVGKKRRLKNPNKRTLVNKKTGKKVVLKRKPKPPRKKGLPRGGAKMSRIA